MKVVQLTGNYPPVVCGVGSYTYFLSHHLAQQGADVYVITSADRTVQETDKPVKVMPIMTHWDELDWAVLKKHLSDIQPDVVHIQYQISAFQNNNLIFSLPYRLSMPVVTTFHDYAGPKLPLKLGTLPVISLLIASNHIVVTHDKPHRTFEKVFFLRNKLTQIPVGSTIPKVETNGKQAHVALSHHNNEEQILVFFGFVWRGKNIEQLIRIQRYLLDHQIRTQLRIIGALRDDDYHHELLQLAEDLNLANHIHFTNDISEAEISNELHNADIGIFPYTNGVTTGHTTVIAAFEHGLPSVTTVAPHSGSSYFVHRHNIMLAPIGDETALQQAVYELLTTPALYNHIQQNLADISQVFSWRTIARTHLGEIYRKAT